MANTGTTIPNVPPQFFTSAGVPASGYQIFTYLSGGTTKTPTYTDAALTVPNTNPIVLDSAGRATIFLAQGIAYKFVFTTPTDTDPPSSPIWTRDTISPVPPAGSASDTDVTGTAGENLSAGDAVYLADGTGGTTTGRWYKTDADAVASSTGAQALGFATAAINTGSSGTIRVGGRVTGLAGLTAGSLYYVSATGGALTTTAPTNARTILQADSTTAGIIMARDPNASSTLQGNLAFGAQTIPSGVKTFPTAPVLTGGATFASGITLGNLAFGRLTSNFTKNASTVFGDVTGLSFTIAANEVWTARFVLYCVSTNAADIKLTLTGPAAPTAVRFSIPGSDVANSAVAFGSNAAISTTGLDSLIVLEAIIRNGANAGTVQLQAAQLASDVSNTVIYAESFVRAERVG